MTRVVKRCVRCKKIALAEGSGVVGEDVCGGCGGRFLPPEITERVVVDELGLERESLREIAGMFSGMRLPCPGCTTLMRPLRLRGVPVDLCFGCGGLWLDAGELGVLSGGRHAEVAVKAVVVNEASAVPDAVVALGRGRFIVVFDDDVAVTQEQLQTAFARTDGLTNVDAQMLARNNHGVVVEGVSEYGAGLLCEVLQRVGVAASVVLDDVLRLPPPLQVNRIEFDDVRLRASFHTGAPLLVPWGEVAAVVAARVHREHLERRTATTTSTLLRSAPNTRGVQLPPESTSELVSSDDVILELLQVGPVTRRLRVVSPTRALAQRAVDAGTAVGRGLTLPDWPRYRRLRELERELCWVAWRAARWPPTQQSS